VFFATTPFSLAIAALSSGQSLAPTQPSWFGSLNLNANIAQSAQDAQSLFLDVRAVNKLAKGNQYDFSGLYIFTRQTSGPNKTFNTTEDRWTITGRYEAPSNNRKFGFIEQRIESNKIVSLGTRYVTTAGFGYFPVRTENPATTGRVDRPGDAEWRLNFGLSYLAENYLNGLGSRTQEGFQLGSNFRKVLNRGVSLSHQFDFIPAFRDFQDFFWVSNLALGIPLNQRTNLSINWITDFDSTPAPGARKDNTKLALTIGFRF
jgi:hypothetical protein